MPGRGRFKDIGAWPPLDAARWRRGLSPASLLDDTGHAATWRPGTVSKVGRAWATLLRWLELTGQLGNDTLPEQRMTPERLDAYCTYLAAAAHGDVPTRRRAVQYRDGLLIAVLACRNMRRGNLTSVEIDRHLIHVDGQWSLIFTKAETKNHRLWINAWPQQLVSHLRRYLDIYRPLLLRGRHDGNELWISQRPGPLTAHGIYCAVTARTKAAFGRSVNPHLFRDAAATSLAIHDPANIAITRHVLGHAAHRTSEDSYNQARSIEASTSLNAVLEQRRNQGDRSRRKA